MDLLEVDAAEEESLLALVVEESSLSLAAEESLDAEAPFLDAPLDFRA